MTQRFGPNISKYRSLTFMTMITLSITFLLKLVDRSERSADILKAVTGSA